MLGTITKNEMVIELKRELDIRESFYARRIKLGQMEKKEANKYYDRMYGAMVFIKTDNIVIKGLTLKDMAVELRREQHLRKEYYAKQIRIGQMKKYEANVRYLRMQAALDYLVERDEQNKGKQTNLFNDSKTHIDDH